MTRPAPALAFVSSLAVLTAAAAQAQPAYFPSTNSWPLTPPSVTAGSVAGASGGGAALGAPAAPLAYGGGSIANAVSPPLAEGSAALPGGGETPTTERGDNPGQGGLAAPAQPVGVASAPPDLANAPGSEAAARLIQADGYTGVQGLARGADGRWRGKALRGTTLVEVSVDGRGNVTSP
ncbi:MAG: hypothetical protein U1E23_08175 [Reyranellaceae bacterium]